MGTNSGTNGDGTCKRKDCYYYSRSTSTCDYRLITSKGRECPVEGCVRYERGTRKAGHHYDARKRTKGNSVMDTVKPDSKTIIPPKPKYSKARKAWYAAVLAEVDKGRDIGEVAAEYGITAKQINHSLSMRRRAADAPGGKARQTDRGKKPERTEGETAVPGAQINGTAALTSCAAKPDGDTVRQNVEETFDRVRQAVDSVKSYDNTKIKAAVLIAIKEIIGQAENRTETGL